MSNKVWVCFDCRTTTRRPATTMQVRKGYSRSIYQSKREHLIYNEKQDVRRIHDLEQSKD